jgi:hypothetical protein
MRKTSHYLDDEHMQLYEWSGASAGTVCGIPEKSERTFHWFAAYSILALMSSLLILNGCKTQSPAEQAVEEMKMKGRSLYEEATSRPVPAKSPKAAGHAMV